MLEGEKEKAHLKGESESGVNREEWNVFASSFIETCEEEASVKSVKNVHSLLQPTIWQPLGEITSEL